MSYMRKVTTKSRDRITESNRGVRDYLRFQVLDRETMYAKHYHEDA